MSFYGYESIEQFRSEQSEYIAKRIRVLESIVKDANQWEVFQ